MVVSTQEELVAFVRRCLTDPAYARGLGRRAVELVESSAERWGTRSSARCDDARITHNKLAKILSVATTPLGRPVGVSSGSLNHGPRSRRNTADKRPIVGHMFEQLALAMETKPRAHLFCVWRLFACFARDHDAANARRLSDTD